MKKILTLVLAFLLITGSLSGCGSKASGTGRLYVSSYNTGRYVKLGDYSNLEVSVATKEEITDDLTKEQALLVYQNNATKENGGVTDRPVENGDMVIIDYVGKKDGVAFQGGTAYGSSLGIGSGQFIDGFEEGLIGVKPGETVDLNLTFKKDYHNAELAGQSVVFTVTVHYILPTQMEDRVVSGFGSEDFKTVDELLAYTREYLETQAENAYIQNRNYALISKLVSVCTFKSLPEDLVAQYREDARINVQNMAASYGLDVSSFLYYFANGMKLEDYVKESAEESVRQLLAAQALAKKEKLVLNKKALDQRITDLAEVNGWESKEQLLAQYEEDELRESIMVQDVADFLCKSAVITHK